MSLLFHKKGQQQYIEFVMNELSLFPPLLKMIYYTTQYIMHITKAKKQDKHDKEEITTFKVYRSKCFDMFFFTEAKKKKKSVDYALNHI